MKFLNHICVHMKSSMTSEDLTTTGRPYGGVGFVCKQKAGFTYDEIKCDSDRVMGLDHRRTRRGVRGGS